MSPRVLRRKLQKKLKRRYYGCCPVCGDRTEKRIRNYYHLDASTKYKLFVVCTRRRPRCSYEKELFWTGGGTVDTHRPEAKADGGGKG